MKIGCYDKNRQSDRLSALGPFINTSREEGVEIGDLESLPVDRVQELPRVIIVNPTASETFKDSDFYRDFKKCLENNPDKRFYIFLAPFVSRDIAFDSIGEHSNLTYLSLRSWGRFKEFAGTLMELLEEAKGEFVR